MNNAVFNKINEFIPFNEQEEMDKIGIKLTVPQFKYCTDNAAMIAAAGYNQYIKENKN